MLISATTRPPERPTPTVPPKADELPLERGREIVPRYRDVNVRCAITELLQRTGAIRFWLDHLIIVTVAPFFESLAYPGSQTKKNGLLVIDAFPP